MNRNLLILALTVVIAAAVLLFVGCPTEPDGTRPYEGQWLHSDGGGSMREKFIFTVDTWELQSQEFNGATWDILWKAKGTMSATPSNFTMTITHGSVPYYYGWFDSSSWDPYDYLYYNYYLYRVYYYWWYYLGGYRSATLNVSYSVSGDSNTLILSIPDGSYLLTRI